MNKRTDSRFAAPDHDHDHCISAALATAEQACAERGLRFTRLRKRVLEIVWQSHAPMKAYDILDQLTPEDGSAAPPTVYRALDFLQSAGLVHRIESQNAYIGCRRPEHAHQGQFLLCQTCGAVAEMDDPGIQQAIANSAEKFGFTVALQTLEITGFCPACRKQTTT